MSSDASFDSGTSDSEELPQVAAAPSVPVAVVESPPASSQAPVSLQATGKLKAKKKSAGSRKKKGSRQKVQIVVTAVDEKVSDSGSLFHSPFLAFLTFATIGFKAGTERDCDARSGHGGAARQLGRA